MVLQITGLKVDVGEGSRGGKIIGHTKSGKPVYGTFNHPSHKDFSHDDHLNAHTIHDNERIKYMKIQNGILPGKKGAAKESEAHHQSQGRMHETTAMDMRTTVPWGNKK